MEPTFSTDIEKQLLHSFRQIEQAITQLLHWNEGIKGEDDYYESSEGLQKLAASCMVIEAIGEAVNRIDKLSQGQLLTLYPQIPWRDVIGLRNHIAHGYFDIDAGIVFSTIRNDLPQLQQATQFFINHLTPSKG